MAERSYHTTIGLEVHIQLATRSKAFCGDSTAFGAEPNTQVSPVSLGHPGTLPRLNEKQVAFAVKLGLALGSTIQQHNSFDRKNYFYADLPKGYQITQDAQPVCRGGMLPIRLGSSQRDIRIHHIHMEEDAGKSMHDQDPRHSLIDLNRAGVPLLELVTEPDLHSAEEVDAFMSAMRQLVRYLGISDGNMEEGSMRCDINVSLRPDGQQRLGQRCEIKNINSMRYARRAIAFEVERQRAILAAGGTVEQQTLHFDAASGQTSPLRDKEEAHDYRYFPEPDLPPLELSPAFIQNIANDLPPMPWQLYQALQADYALTPYDVELLTEELPVARYFLALAAHSPHHKAAANLIINRILPLCKEWGITAEDFPPSLKSLAGLLDMMERNVVGSSAAYQQLLPAMIDQPHKDPETLARELNLLQTSDEDILASIVSQVLEGNPEEVKRYRQGKKALIGFFMGQVMKASKGKADPKVTQQLLREKLG